MIPVQGCVQGSNACTVRRVRVCIVDKLGANSILVAIGSSTHKCRRSAPPLLDLPVDPLSHRLRMPRQHTAPARRPSQEERNGAQYIRPAGLAQIPDHFKPDPTAPSMKLNVCVRGSITNTEEAAVAAQYSIPSGPAQMPKYFRPPSSAPSMKLSVRAHGSITNTEEVLNGEQYRSPSGPAQISLYFIPPSPAP